MCTPTDIALLYDGRSPSALAFVSFGDLQSPAVLCDVGRWREGIDGAGFLCRPVSFGTREPMP